MKILICEDEIGVVNILKRYLKYKGFDADHALNGKAALELIKSQNYDIVFMDINMPILDGFKATERIIELLKKNKKNHIPIIAITANVSNADVDLCFKSGMIKFLAKPVKRKDLGLTLQYLLKLNHK